MKKLIKRFLKLLPGGRSFINHYKQLVKENAELKKSYENHATQKDGGLSQQDYQVFFTKNNS